MAPAPPQVASLVKLLGNDYPYGCRAQVRLRRRTRDSSCLFLSKKIQPPKWFSTGSSNGKVKRCDAASMHLFKRRKVNEKGAEARLHNKTIRHVETRRFST